MCVILKDNHELNFKECIYPFMLECQLSRQLVLLPRPHLKQFGLPADASLSTLSTSARLMVFSGSLSPQLLKYLSSFLYRTNQRFFQFCGQKGKTNIYTLISLKITTTLHTCVSLPCDGSPA